MNEQRTICEATHKNPNTQFFKVGLIRLGASPKCRRKWITLTYPPYPEVGDTLLLNSEAYTAVATKRVDGWILSR